MTSIQRADVAGLIPEDYSNAFLDATVEQSACLSTFRTIRVGTAVTQLPTLSALPTAGFVAESETDPTGVKPKSKVEWQNSTINISEAAVIIPIHENVIEDSTIDLWAFIRPLVGQAFGQLIDDAILFGTGKPSTWPNGLVSQATTAGSVATISTDIADAFNDAFAFVEGYGYDANVVYAGPAMRSRLRGLRTDDGAFLYTDLRGGGVGGSGEQVYGAGLRTVRNGVWDDSQALALCADSSKLVVALRSDMSYKLLDQATLGTGESAVNLAERDMVGLRVRMRLGWQTVINANALSATPVPFSIVAAAAGS